MRLTNKSDAVWRQGGVPATEAAALFNVAAEDREHCLALWAHKVRMREGQLVRRQPELLQGSPEWLRWRRAGVGGSEVAAVVGAEYRGYRSSAAPAAKVWKEKVEGGVDVAKNENIERGNRLEPLARRLYEEMFDWSVAPACVLHDEYDFVRCSLDGLRADEKLVAEIKCPRENNYGKMLAIQAIADPLERQQAFSRAFDYWRYQALYQLLITGADVLHFVGHNPDRQWSRRQQLVVIELYPEPLEQERLLRRVVEFWAFVENREPPPLEWSFPCAIPPSQLRLPDGTLVGD